MYKNFMKLEFPSKSCNETFVRNAVADFVAQLDPTAEELADIRTAVSEAVNNAIVYGYPEKLGMITVKCTILSNDTLSITIKDKGVGIKDVKRAMMPMYTTGGSDHSGMGFTIMQSFMSECKVISQVGKGTTVHMKKHIISRKSWNNNM